MLHKRPNLVVVGQIFSGKTAIANTLEAEFGYDHINTGGFIRNWLAETQSHRSTFRQSDYKQAREELIATQGILYFLPSSLAGPTVIDGVRSRAVMEALAERDYLGVLVTSCEEERLRRSQEISAAEKVKHGIENIDDLRAVDQAQSHEIESLLPYISYEVQNGASSNLTSLCRYVIGNCMAAPA